MTVHDPRMAERSALWVLGPREPGGDWGAVRSAVGGGASISVEGSGLAEYLVVVGPSEPGGFLPRYPGSDALLELETEDGFEEETARLVSDSDDRTVLVFEGEFDPEFELLAGRHFRIEDPVTEADRVGDLSDNVFGLLFASECVDARCEETHGELLAFAPRAWTRHQLFAPENATSLDDARLAALNDPQEGFFTVFTKTSPHRPEESFQILEALGADGRPDFEDPALVRVVPLAFGDCEVDVVRAPECGGSDRSCRIPICLGTPGPAPDDLPIHAYRATALDIDETSLYDIEASCEGDCAPSAAPTRYPVYLAHGFNSSREVWDDVTTRVVAGDERWRGWIGAQSVPAFEPVWRRARQLRRNLSDFLDELEKRGVEPPAGESFQRLNVIAHSMGGLDCRILIGDPRYNDPQCHEVFECASDTGEPEACCDADAEGRAIPWRERIASVTTLSTPHRGSSFADLGVDLLEKDSVDWAFRKAARYILGLDTEAEQQYLRETLYTLSNGFSEETMTPDYPPIQPDRVYSFGCTTENESCEIPENADLPLDDDPLPRPNELTTFFGWASESCVTGSCGSIVDPGLVLSYAVVKGREGASDGVVATNSARFGIYMGIRANDHFHWNRLSFAQVVDIAARAFGIRREPVDRFYTHWLGTLSRSGY
jgi:pimeloyl-ACP methyl ester carboxylesterase